MTATPEQIATFEDEEREAEAFVTAQWQAADKWIAAEWPHATDSERAMARSLCTELACQRDEAVGLFEQRLRAVLDVVRRYLPPDGTDAKAALSEIIALVDPWPEQPLADPVPLLDIAEACGGERAAKRIVYMGEGDLTRFAARLHASFVAEGMPVLSDARAAEADADIAAGRISEFPNAAAAIEYLHLCEPSGETMAQREEVCAAWHALPDELRKDDRLTPLYRALGGPSMGDPCSAGRGVPGTSGEPQT